MAKSKNTEDDVSLDDSSVNYEMGVIPAQGYGDEDKSILDEYSEEVDDEDEDDARKRVLARGQDKEDIVPGSTRDEDPWSQNEKFDSDEWPEDLE